MRGSRQIQITSAVCALLVLGGAFGSIGAAPAHKTAAARKTAPAAAQVPAPASLVDHTLDAMRDEMSRSRDRLAIPLADQGAPVKPYYIEYRLLDLDERTITAEFGALISSTSSRNRLMSVDVRVGNYQVDSSNFIGSEGFAGFLGSTGQVGIDHDYDSLREDLWLATDQAYKEALENLSKKQAFLNRLANAPTIADFSEEATTNDVEPLEQPDWTTRNWEAEAKSASAALRAFPQINGSRVTYRLIFTTTYLMTSEGTVMRTNRSLAAIEASMAGEADDGTGVHNFYATYANTAGELPTAQNVHDALVKAAQELVTLRAAPPMPDYEGPILFDNSASGSLLAQILGPSLSGARGPVSMVPQFDEMMERLGGTSQWTGRPGTRVLATSVNLVDDPTLKQWNGQELIGAYDVDEEGVKAQKVTVVDSGILRQLLMSRRPGPDFDHSNGHARSTFLADPRPMLSNLFFNSNDTTSPAALKQKFLDACKQDGQTWCIEVRRMDNPVLAVPDQDDMSDFIALAASGAATGDRLPLLVYRVYVADGHEELMRGARLQGLTIKTLRNLDGIGSDPALFSFAQNQIEGFGGTALAAFGSADGGVPSAVIAPSLLFDDVEVRGPRGEPERLPLVSPPPLD
ncbi:MAG: metallopeptidase TldD-related protein [Candidatus Acidiferrales bacterium]